MRFPSFSSIRYARTRTKILLGLGVVVLIAAGVAAYVYIFDEETIPGSEIAVTDLESGANAAEPLAADEATSLLYRSGRSLVLHGIENAESESLGEVPSNEIAASTATQWVAFVAPEGTAGEEARDQGLEGVNAPPTIYVIDPTNDEDAISLGYGIQPHWDPTGRLVAFLRPLAPLECEASACDSDSEIVIADPETGEEEVIGEPGPYNLRDWGGDHLYLTDSNDLEHTLVVGIDGTTSTLDMPQAQFRDVSPDGSYMISTVEEGAEITPLVDGAVSGDPTEIEGSLLEAAWSHDSSRVATIFAPEGREEPSITLYEPDSSEGETVEQTTGAAGPLLWSPDNGSLAFVRTVPLTKKQTALQAAYCPVDEEGGCGFLFTWERDVILLRLQ